MGQVQPTGVQQQAPLRRRAIGTVQRIAHDRVTEGLQMDAQLVGPTGDGFEQESGDLRLALQDSPAGLARPAPLHIDPLAGPLWPVGGQRQVNAMPMPALRGFNHAMHHRQILLVHLVRLEGLAQPSLALGLAGHQHQARGGHIEPVHNPCVRPTGLHPCAQAVLLVWSAPRYGQQASGLIEHDQVLIDINDLYAGDIGSCIHGCRLSAAQSEPLLQCRPMADPTQLRDLWRLRDYMRMWGARLSGTAAQQMLMVAVGWQMYELTSSAWDLGLVGLYQFVPALILTLPAGHAADRLHRGRIVAACLVAQAVAALILLAATQGWGQASTWLSRELLLGLSLLLGLTRAFQMPAQQALAPLLVPPALLPRATAFNSAGTEVAVIGGPALAGLVFVAGAGAVYALCLAFLLLASVLALRLQYRHQPPAREPLTAASVFAGLTFVWRSKLLLGAVSLDLFAVLLGGATALLPIFAKDILQVGPWGLGLLRAAPAVGALIMSLVLTRWSIERRVGPKLMTAVAVYGLCMLIFGLSTHFVLSLVVLALSGAADMVSVVIRMTLVQLETPDDMRGRVSAVNSISIGASNQLGEFESGATAAWLGPVGSVVLGACGTLLVAALWLRLFPDLAGRDRMSEQAGLRSS